MERGEKMSRNTFRILPPGSELGVGQTSDLFESLDGAGPDRTGDVLPVERGGGSPVAESVSIKWYAEQQAEYRAAGEKSAAAWWASKGVKYP